PAGATRTDRYQWRLPSTARSLWVAMSRVRSATVSQLRTYTTSTENCYRVRSLARRAAADSARVDRLRHVDVLALHLPLHADLPVVAVGAEGEIAGAGHRIAAGASNLERQPRAGARRIAHTAVLLSRHEVSVVRTFLHAQSLRHRGHGHASHVHLHRDVVQVVAALRQRELRHGKYAHDGDSEKAA